MGKQLTSMGLISSSVCIALVLLQSAAGAREVTQVEMENRRCQNCHGQSRLGELAAGERVGMVAPRPGGEPADPNPRPGLYVSPQAMAGSVHKSLACIDCHTDAKGQLPHAAELKPATCNGTCHGQAASDFLQGAHAAASARGDEHAPTCTTCHGAHEMLPSRDRSSLTHPLNIVKVCGDCHSQYQTTTSNGGNGAEHVAMYLESVHGRAVTKGGLSVAATCADCHGAHKVMPSSHPQSRVNRLNVSDTCGKCHVGISEVYEKSVHGELLAKDEVKGPVCISCHTAHAITDTDKPGFMLDIVSECGTCHSDLYGTYRRSYHGQVTRLGWERAARCSSCHGAHDVRRVDDPLSHMHLESGNRLQTCQEAGCHPNAKPKFAEFLAHADYRDRENYPVLWGVWMYFVVVMSAAFGFFGLHSVLWFTRSAIERVKNGPHPKFKSNPHAIQRFNRVDRVNHAFVIVSFFGLTITGLPLLYSDKAWAQGLISAMGGVGTAGILHRFFAIILIGNFVVHGAGIINRIRKHGLINLLFGPNTMLPRWKDVKDCAGMWRWFFKGGKKPKFDRWTYWEKFDYVAEVGGSAIIGISGLMLWFPEFFSNFLPGWMFNVATIVHGYEALLAIGFIFTIHFFNAHLRMEKFPVDDVMFTGRLPEEEFKHEREAEYERLAASGELEALRVAPPPPWYRTAAVVAGILAMAIGTTLVVLIVLAGLGVI